VGELTVFLTRTAANSRFTYRPTNFNEMKCDKSLDMYAEIVVRFIMSEFRELA